MEGYRYQSVCVVEDPEGRPLMAVPDVDSAVVIANGLGEGHGVETVPVVQMAWFPELPEAQEQDGGGIDG